MMYRRFHHIIFVPRVNKEKEPALQELKNFRLVKKWEDEITSKVCYRSFKLLYFYSVLLQIQDPAAIWASTSKLVGDDGPPLAADSSSMSKL